MHNTITPFSPGFVPTRVDQACQTNALYVEEPQPDVELGNTQNTRGSRVWFARDSVSEVGCGQSLHLPKVSASEPCRGGSSIQEKSPIPMSVAIRDEHDAAVAGSFSTETCSTGGDASTMGEGMAPAEEQGDGHEVVVAKGGLKGQVFPVELSC